ncbi:hypothetical protein ScalyP_jg2986 [Parmales sp. scaly parma]|nr:hypothetical protein ScalyP_jg2986 [Parmales sp. scaly parma]
MGEMVSSLLFQPPPPSYLSPTSHFWLPNRQIPAFFIDNGAKISILFSHGNAEDLGMIYSWFVDIAQVLEVNVLAYDYTGYGKSQGTPSEEDCYEDIQCAYDFLTKTRGIIPENIILYGRSLGSGPSIYLASKTATEGRSVAGVILQSPLLSAYRVAFNFRFTMPGDKFANVDRIANVRCPTFIVHGAQDEVVPFWHGQELFLTLPQVWRAKPFWVQAAGHNNIEALSKQQFLDHIKNFMDGHIPARWGLVSPPLTVPQCIQHQRTAPPQQPQYQQEGIVDVLGSMLV